MVFARSRRYQGSFSGSAGKLLLAVLLIACALRFAFVWHPTDYHSVAAWRESDYTQIARSFFREGMNPFLPRIDWRGNTSGVVEMELPVIPWIGAQLYRIFGYHEQLLRGLVALSSIGGLLVFRRLSSRLLPPHASLFATTAFAFNGLLLSLSTSIQPESLQLLMTLLAITAAFEWADKGDEPSLLRAAAFTAGAILVKGSSAYLGLVLGYLVLKRLGLRAATQQRVYVATAIALLPPLAWYLWAHHNFDVTGLSLGLSNEAHFLSWDVLRHPRGIVTGNLVAEVRDVFAAAGLPLAAAAFLRPWDRIERTTVWYAAVVIFYIVAADTSADGWAFYYHANSIPPVCLLMGFGFAALTDRAQGPLASGRLAGFKSGAAYLLAAVTLGGFLARGVQLAWLRNHQPVLEELYRCCREFAPAVPPHGKIVVRGGRRLDWHGHGVAYNESMAFTWTDRKGFNYAHEDFSAAKLEEIARLGGRYWIAKPQDLEDKAVMSRITPRVSLIQRCGDYALYDLGPSREGTSSNHPTLREKLDSEGNTETPVRTVR
ncbi:MAG: hypothetical protein GY769_13160 [bacterium]|nr:hypothetical protein [bacterium]